MPSPTSTRSAPRQIAAAALTRQLLTFARRDVAHPEPVEVNRVVRSVVAMLDRTLGEQITLQLTLGEGSLVAVADPHQLEQIVLNLAINARDAMPGGGTLTIGTYALHHDVEGSHQSDVALDRHR